jgi:hypothetical protein
MKMEDVENGNFEKKKKMSNSRKEYEACDQISDFCHQ